MVEYSRMAAIAAVRHTLDLWWQLDIGGSDSSLSIAPSQVLVKKLREIPSIS